VRENLVVRDHASPYVVSEVGRVGPEVGMKVLLPGGWLDDAPPCVDARLWPGEPDKNAVADGELGAPVADVPCRRSAALEVGEYVIAGPIGLDELPTQVVNA
jgi:hypothetical protein